MKQSIQRLIKPLILAFIVILAGFIFYHKVYLPKNSYQTVTPLQQDLTLTASGVGEVAAKTITPITPTYAGKVQQILVDVNDTVQPGQVIAKMDPVDFPAQLEQAKANAEKLHYQRLAIKQTQISLQAQLSLAEKELQRNRDLIKKGFSAQQAYDNAVTTVKKLKAEVAANRLTLTSLEAEERAQQYAISAMQDRLKHLTLHAPYAGIVIQRNAQPGQSLAATQPVVTLVDPTTFWIKTYLDERLSGPIQVNTPASLSLRSNPQHLLKGRIVRIEPITDPVTHERQIEVKLAAPISPMSLNAQAEVTFEYGTLKGVLTVPARAVVTKNDQTGVWIVQSGKAHFLPIERVGQQGERIAVKGVTDKVQILLPNGHLLSEGQAVKIKASAAL